MKKEKICFIPHEDPTPELEEMKRVYQTNLRDFIIQTLKEQLDK